jgi:hypothetical protein
MAVLGLVGGPLMSASGIAVLLGAFAKGSAGQVMATIPEFVWELSLGVYLIVKGFKPSPILLDFEETPNVAMDVALSPT